MFINTQAHMNTKITLLLLLFCFMQVIVSAQQQIDKTMQHDGRTRSYTVYVPANYNADSPIPLLFNFHGGNGDISSQIFISDMRPIADTARFIVVYPQAAPDPSDDGSTNWLHKDPSSIDDVTFVDAMIDSLSAEYNIDLGRIYACGYSLGGEFTFELACRLNERIAAIGVVARTMGAAAYEHCAPSHPTGVITILGTDDSTSPYDGLVFGGIQYYLSADETHAYWIGHNNADTDPIVNTLPNTNTSDGSTVEQYLWENGTACVTIEHLKVINGGHDWPGTFGNMDIDSNLAIWNYVSQYNTSGKIVCTTSVENATDLSEDIQLFPNPAHDRIYVQTEQSDWQYELYTSTGKLVQKGMNSHPHIDLSQLETGMYIIKIGEVVSRIIKR